MLSGGYLPARCKECESLDRALPRVANLACGTGRYEKSSFGWNPAKKKREMFHKLGRFILVRSNESTKVIAFTSFRFEEEEEFGVVYWSVND